jgi:hypothetical protein
MFIIQVLPPKKNKICLDMCEPKRKVLSFLHRPTLGLIYKPALAKTPKIPIHLSSYRPTPITRFLKPRVLRTLILPDCLDPASLIPMCWYNCPLPCIIEPFVDQEWKTYHIHNSVTKVHSKRVLIKFPFGLSLKENTSFSFLGGWGRGELWSLCNKKNKNPMLLIQRTSVKKLWQSFRTIIGFLNLFTLLVWWSVHHKIGKEKPIENSVV